MKRQTSSALAVDSSNTVKINSVNTLTQILYVIKGRRVTNEHCETKREWIEDSATLQHKLAAGGNRRPSWSVTSKSR